MFRKWRWDFSIPPEIDWFTLAFCFQTITRYFLLSILSIFAEICFSMQHKLWEFCLSNAQYTHSSMYHRTHCLDLPPQSSLEIKIYRKWKRPQRKNSISPVICLYHFKWMRKSVWLPLRPIRKRSMTHPETMYRFKFCIA